MRGENLSQIVRCDINNIEGQEVRRGVQGIALKPNQGANLALSSAPHIKKESRDILVIAVP